MSASVKWIVIIALLLVSGLAPFLLVRAAPGWEITEEAYEWISALVIIAYGPAILAKNRTAWLWIVIAVCVFSWILLMIGASKVVFSTSNSGNYVYWIWTSAAVHLVGWFVAAVSWLTKTRAPQKKRKLEES